MSGTQFLERPGGKLAYSVTGAGPLVVCSPGVGDLRSTFTDLTRLLLAGGLRVATVELRGHGESSTDWPSYTENDVADDLLALSKELDDRPAVLLGSDYSGRAAVIAAAKAPDAVAGIVLSRAFVKDPPYNPTERAMTSLAALPGVGQTLWMSHWPTLFATKPANFEQRRHELAASLAEPGRFEPVCEMFKRDHAAEQALPDAGCPALVVVGDRDPDCPDPAADAAATAGRLGGPATVLVVPGAGHYPHAEDPERVALAVVAFVRDSCQLAE
ncbi:alpha/beta fold hydrolase [Kibdelosporangium aridum]|uniref:Pimeloyl-ACP methyl ester carboxylesterase n=1 Tax=Kibdelosporangium aridum TaxID=2030 RepID=A0A1W2FER7_KIBAR|nr:alpha/beta hydrolase [Kibdelosporangium aridum]SMD20380.1 Pimeloyl-ACP methyl ester carboxylesterase [Kibdelosporangium aridum]